MQNGKEWASHGSDEQKSHQQVRDTLLDDGRCLDDGAANLGLFSLGSGNDLESRFIDSQ